MVSESPDPTVVRSIAVTTGDVVTALEANRTTSRRVVLRLTPPFSGRMRARLHVEHDGEYEMDDGAAEMDPRPVHVAPGDLLVDDAPGYPDPDETENELRKGGTPYTVERHHDYHAAAVAEWRKAVPDAVRDRITLETTAGPHEVTVKVLKGNI